MSTFVTDDIAILNCGSDSFNQEILLKEKPITKVIAINFDGDNIIFI